jgi:hypothetical protein
MGFLERRIVDDLVYVELFYSDICLRRSATSRAVI